MLVLVQQNGCWWYTIISQSVSRKDWMFMCKVKGIKKKNQWISRLYLVNCLAFCRLTWNVIQSSGAVLSGTRKVCCRKGQGHSKVCFCSSFYTVLFQANLTWPHIMISQNVLWKDWIAIFEISATAKVQKFSEYCFLSGLHLLSYWHF